MSSAIFCEIAEIFVALTRSEAARLPFWRRQDVQSFARHARRNFRVLSHTVVRRCGNMFPKKGNNFPKACEIGNDGLASRVSAVTLRAIMSSIVRVLRAGWRK